MIDYRLKAAAVGPVTLEILDATGKLVRRFASTDKPEQVNPKTLVIDPRWVRPAANPPGCGRLAPVRLGFALSAAGRAAKSTRSPPCIATRRAGRSVRP